MFTKILIVLAAVVVAVLLVGFLVVTVTGWFIFRDFRASRFYLEWLYFWCFKLPGWALGWGVVPFMYKYRGVHIDTMLLDRKWMKPWLNPEDWRGGPKGTPVSLPRWWIKKYGDEFKSFYRYHARRNPANGLRNYDFLSVAPRPEQMTWLASDSGDRVAPHNLTKYWRYYEPGYMRKRGGKFAWYWCWQGKKAGFKMVWLWSETRHFVIKLGWRIEPRDAEEGLAPTNVRYILDTAGFATKFQPWRKG